MICPECNGVGRVQKRFLLFFTRGGRCPKCLGTGVFPPPVREVIRDRTRYRDDDDDRWPSASYGSTRTDSGAREDDRFRNEERFEVGSGGRSGGGGGGASWDAAGGSDAPVIADPFSSVGSSIVGAAVAGAAISSDSSSSTSDSSASSSSSSSSDDGGTSY